MPKSKEDVKFPLKHVVQVRWRDASTMSAWHHLEEYHEHGPAHCESVGYLLRINRSDLVLLQTISADAQGNCGISIPKDWVVSIKTIGSLPKGAKVNSRSKIKKAGK